MLGLKVIRILLFSLLLLKRIDMFKYVLSLLRTILSGDVRVGIHKDFSYFFQRLECSEREA